MPLIGKMQIHLLVKNVSLVLNNEPYATSLRFLKPWIQLITDHVKYSRWRFLIKRIYCWSVNTFVTLTSKTRLVYTYKRNEKKVVCLRRWWSKNEFSQGILCSKPRENLMSYGSPRDWMRQSFIGKLCINVGTGNKTWR